MSEVTVEVPGEALPVENEAQQVEVVEEEATASEVEEVEESGAEDTPKRKPGIQKRLDELTANWRQEQRRAQELQAMVDRLLPQKEQAKPEPQVQPLKEPKLEEFQTYEEWVRASAKYEAAQEVRQLLAEQGKAEVEKQKQSRHEAFIAKAESFATTTPDFEEVAFNPRLAITETMATVLDQSDQGPQILYHLGKHPEEAMRIAGLSDYQVGLEIGRLEARVTLPQPKTVTQAPPPIRPLSGGSGSAIVDPDKMTSDEWRKWREDQLRKR
jgi:hypothetical protein